MDGIESTHSCLPRVHGALANDRAQAATNGQTGMSTNRHVPPNQPLQVGVMLMKPNVYADFSVQPLLRSTRALSTTLRAWLEWAPEKVMFGTDAYFGVRDTTRELGGKDMGDHSRGS